MGDPGRRPRDQCYLVVGKVSRFGVTIVPDAGTHHRVAPRHQGGEQLSVEITDVEDDPTFLGEEGELRELQITYRITEGHDRSSELGVTTLVEDEKVALLP